MNLAVAHILQHKIRSLICILAVCLGITMLLVFVGMVKGSINEVARRIQNVGADMIVQQAAATNFLALKSGVLPMKLIQDIEEIPHVQAVSPVLTWTVTFRNQFYVVYGIDPRQFSSIGGELKITRGRHLQNVGELVIDSRMAGATGTCVGDTMDLLGSKFTVVGISKEGIGARIFLLLSELQSMLQQEDKVSMFFVKCTSPQYMKEVALDIEERVKGVKCQLLENFADEMTRSMIGLNQFIGAITVTTLVISFLVILLAMYTTIMEQTREIGILKSLGASKVFVMRSILLESTLLTIGGVLTGYLLTLLSKYYLIRIYPLLTIEITSYWVLVGTFLGIAGGILGAFYPALIAVRQDPVKALNYE
jgi:putative ABC transport system permease protein